MFAAVPGRLVPGRYRSLFADRTFRQLMPVFALSDLGDGMTVVAVAWMALALAPDGGQGALIGIAVAAYILPGALGALVLGRSMRRLPAQRLLILDSGLRAVLLGTIPLAYVAGALTPAVYVGLLGLWTATIAGPALASLLVGLISPAWIIGLDAATFAVLALQTGRTSLPAAATPVPAAGDTRHGLSILRRQPDLLALLVVTWLFNLAFGPVEVALPLFVTDELHAGSELLGQYWAAFGIGAVIGALALGVARRLPLWPAMLAIIAGHGIGMLPFAVTHTAVPSLLGFAFAGLVYGPYSALSFTVLQDRALADSLTTVLAARSAVLLTASPLGAASGGFLVDLTSAPAVLTGCGGLMILIAVISATMPKLTPSPGT